MLGGWKIYDYVCTCRSLLGRNAFYPSLNLLTLQNHAGTVGCETNEPGDLVAARVTCFGGS